MTPEQIIEQIWQLPWYSILWIVIVDDLIFMAKTWPIWVMVFAILVVLSVSAYRIKQAEELRRMFP